jgi:hypothetical protein
MPYITKETRKRLDYPTCLPPETPGELNYALTKVVLRYLGPEPNYQRFNDVLGALEGCKLELYRRHIAIYENGKLFENGDAF